MSYTAEKVLSIARNELNYCEKETNKNLDSKTANAGDGNYTKYARDLEKAGYYQAGKNGFAWCDMFHDWCHWMASGKNKTVAEKTTCQTGLYGAGCVWSAKYYKEQNRFFKDGKPGDQIFFSNFSHTGIVEKIENNIVTTIEGNTKNKVARRTYKINDPKIDGYGRPKYAKAAVKEEKKKIKLEVSFEQVSKGLKGTSVKVLQALLGCKVDGDFGNETDKAVRAFQKKSGLAVDGVVGEKTWKALMKKV